MTEEVMIAIISAIPSILVAVITIIMNNRVIAYKIDALETKVEKHNQLVERMYNVEARADVLDEKVKVANHRIDDLENE